MSNQSQKRQVRRLLDAPTILSRPLALVGGRGYAAMWERIEVIENGEVKNPYYLCVICDDGTRYGDAPAVAALPLSTLNMEIALPRIHSASHLWSARGTDAYIDNRYRPNPADVFQQIKDIVNRFIDFSKSFAKQEAMCELIACYVMSTYFTESFDVVGYLCANGRGGSGKTKLISIVGELSYLGQTILSSSTFATLRDSANHGATMVFDDAERLMEAKSDEQKKLLEWFLGGSSRGKSITFNERVGDHWEHRSVSTFCPRVFSAIKKPKGTLETRTIVIALARSQDKKRTKVSPTNPTAWPDDDRRRLIDDLWALALGKLPNMRTYWDEAACRANLAGRNLDPWQGVFAVALFVEAHGVAGLFQRMERLSLTYQRERADAEADDPDRLLILALDRMYDSQKSAPAMVFAPRELAETMNQLADEQGLGNAFITPEKVASLMKQMRRFQKLPDDNKGARWKVTRRDLLEMFETYAITRDGQQRDFVQGYPMVPPGVDEQDVPRCGTCEACLKGGSPCTAPDGGAFVGLSPFTRAVHELVSPRSP